ncbi:MAG TPA: prepilin-type N-terminal cleavage/methylation domain-containing protein [Verrucomicrobiae bacterium]|nr:prepilin-type N-terminal cleavage/methylation domain-containing protein [Verrucomicrobiae bacterium]
MRALISGFTITELLVATAILSVVLGGVLFAHIFGLSMFQLTRTKLNALDDTRKVMGRMTQEIRACRAASVGNVKAGKFEALLDGEKQQGTALLIRSSTNTSKFIIYFVNPSDQTFRRTTSTPGSAVIIAESITNSLVFSARNHSGAILTNNQNNRVIHANLEFFAPRSHLQPPDYYKMETSVTRRALE